MWPIRCGSTQFTRAAAKSVVMMKLEAVGLRGAAKLMPSELSGGMMAPRRVGARHRSGTGSSCSMSRLSAGPDYHGRSGEADFKVNSALQGVSRGGLFMMCQKVLSIAGSHAGS